MLRKVIWGYDFLPNVKRLSKVVLSLTSHHTLFQMRLIVLLLPIHLTEEGVDEGVMSEGGHHGGVILEYLKAKSV